MGQSLPTPFAARTGLVVAAVLWSSGSLFMRLLDQPSVFHVDTPNLTPVQRAFFRGLFAGIALTPLLRRADIRLRPTMMAMVALFAVMSGFYLSALGLGSAANAIFLQNTAPVWVCLIGAAFLGQSADRRTWQSVLLGLAGALVIVGGNWPQGLSPHEQTVQTEILLMAVGSGITYAGVMLFLGHLRHESSAWLTVLNLAGSALCLGVCFGTVLLIRDGPDAALNWFRAPTPQQLVFLAVFGVVQMAIPYCLFTRGIRVVGPQEAGIITLLEPILNPVWAYLIAPDKETPTQWTLVGGGLLLLALAWKYLPSAAKQSSSPS